MNKPKLLAILLCFSIFNISFAYGQDKVILSHDFSNGATEAGWTINDANSDGATWMSIPELNGISYNGISTVNTADDWLFTPLFSVESGKHYHVSYTISQRGSFNADNVEIFYGNTASPDAMTNTVTKEIYNNNTGMVTRHCHISPSISGDLTIGFKLTSPAGNGIVSFKSILIKETAGQCPQPAPAMTASSDAASKTVKIKWINSKRDIENATISTNMEALIYQDDILVTTVANMIPGEKAEYSFSPDNFNGKHTYSVALKIDNISEKASKTINLDDVQGGLVPVYTFPMTKTDFNDNWVVENKDGGNTWTYYSKTAYVTAFGKNINDWLITPGYELETGKRYCLTYKISTSLTYPASFDVTIGKKQSSSGQTKVITNYTDLYQNGFAQFTSNQFDVTEAGTYYFGFHATYVGNSLDVSTVTINYIDTGTGSSEEEELNYVEHEETVLPDNNNGNTSLTTDYHKRFFMEGVEFRAVLTQAQIDEYTMATNGIYTVQHFNDTYDVDLKNPILEADYAGGCTYHEGKLYCNEYNSQGNYQEDTPVWKILDAKDFSVISTDTLNTNCENTTISLAYDASTDKIYGFVKDYVDTWLVEINPENGEMTRISDKMDYWKRFLTIGCDLKGNLFCIYMTEDNVTGDQKHYLSRINKTNGQIADIGEITASNMLPEDILVNMKYRQALFFDNSTGKMYWMMCSSSMAIGSQYAPIFEINPINCNAVMLTWLEDIYAISGAYFEEPVPDAPGIISDFSYTPDELGTTTGTISFNVPANSYSGMPMTIPVTYSIKEENGINVEGTAIAGENVKLHVESSQGLHKLNIQLSNEAGYGPIVQRSFLIGFDMPAAPENIVLTDTLLTTTLRWNAPKKGIYGEVYDKTKLTYEIVRYPDKVSVAKNMTDTVFVESHGKDLSRYYYVVYSCSDNERTQGAVSNDVVVGDPINPPYGGVFSNINELINYYTILDFNNDGYTWSYDSETGAVLYPYNYQQAADDWLISPPIIYNESDSYTLTFSTFSSSAEYPESMSVTFGKGKNPESLTTQLLDLPEVPAQEDDGTITTYQLPIHVYESGVYYYGFKAYSKEYQEYLFLYNITLSRISGNHNTTIENKNFAAYNEEGNIKVINPYKDIIKIYNINGTLIEMFSSESYSVNVAPGIYIIKSSSSATKMFIR